MLDLLISLDKKKLPSSQLKLPSRALNYRILFKPKPNCTVSLHVSFESICSYFHISAHDQLLQISSIRLAFEDVFAYLHAALCTLGVAQGSEDVKEHGTRSEDGIFVSKIVFEDFCRSSPEVPKMQQIRCQTFHVPLIYSDHSLR